MMPIWHIFFGALASIVLYLLEIDLILILIFFLASWFIIDLDHVLFYSVKYRNINPFKFWKVSLGKKTFRQDKKYKKPVWIFHSLEFLLILALLSFFNKIVFFVFLGFLFHLVFDWANLIYQKKQIHYKVSLIYTLINNRKLKSL